LRLLRLGRVLRARLRWVVLSRLRLLGLLGRVGLLRLTGRRLA